MRWISSEGGPLILIGKNSLLNWKGAEGGDYERACSVDDYAGIITVAGSHALILGDEPCQTAVYEAESLGLLIVRWQWAESEASVQSVVERLSIEDFKDPEEEIDYKVDDNSLLLFDSVLSGKDAEGLSVTLAGSNYLVSTICYTPNDETSLILHKFTLKDQNGK